MDNSAHRRPQPKVPEPIEDDPFEMDWPWPCQLPQAEAPSEPRVVPERSLSDDLDDEESAEEQAPVEGNGK